MNLDREPALRELLVDPLLHVLMARDGVDYRNLLDLIDDARVRLGLPAIADADTLTCLVETAPVSAAKGCGDRSGPIARIEKAAPS